MEVNPSVRDSVKRSFDDKVIYIGISSIGFLNILYLANICCTVWFIVRI